MSKSMSKEQAKTVQKTIQTSVDRITFLMDNAVAAVDILREVYYLTESLSDLGRNLTDDARSEGASWTAIGNAWGISRQAAQQRFYCR